MKHNHYLPGILSIIALLAGSVLNAQPAGNLIPASAPIASGGPIPSGPGRLNPDNWTGIRSPYYQEIIALTTLSGTVEQLTGNEEDVLDGFILNTGSSTVTIHFPPHLGQLIHSAIKPEVQVSVTGFSDMTSEGQDIFRLTQLTAGKTVISETSPVLPAVLPPPSLTTVKGKVVAYKLDREGRANGLILSDQTWIRVPLLLGRQLVGMVPKGSTVSVDGYLQQPAEGHFMLQKHTILLASVLTINGQSYLIR